MQYYLDAFRLFFGFSGRATRTAFWMFSLINLLIYIVFFAIEVGFNLPTLSLAYALLMLIPGLAYGARRLHDTGRSGWWQLIYLVPFGIIVVTILHVLPSQPDNKYGFAEEAV